MGATVVGDTIYISKDLDEKITSRERRVIYAHEIKHWRARDSWKLLFMQIIFFAFPAIVKRYRRKLEMAADLYSIIKTKDPEAFTTLLGKLERDDTYPDKQASLRLAERMKGTI